MSDDDVQNYGNHRRWNAPWHFVVLRFCPSTRSSRWRRCSERSREAAWVAIVATAVVGAAALLRRMALTVQNRVIRLEEELRLHRLLPERHEDIEELTLDQLIAIRFASGLEVPHLVDRVISGEIKTQDEIKRSVQHWRPDHLRV